MTNRRGFTLLETIVALTLGAIVLTLASTAVGAASDARAAVERDRESGEAESRVRAMLVDMLRHPPRAEAVDEPLLRLERDGQGGVALVFLSRGVIQPFGTGGVWRVRLQADSTNGAVALRATPIASDGAERGTPLELRLPHLASQHVAVLEEAGAGWRLDWPLTASRPALVRIEWRGAGDGIVVAPLVVTLDPLRGAPPSRGGSMP